MRQFFPFLTHNLGLKIFSLLLALLLWFHTRTERVYLLNYELPVEFVAIPDSLFVLNELPKSLKVDLRGKGKDLIMLRFSHPRAEINLHNLTPGKRELELTPSLLHLPENADFSLAAISPKAIELIVDQLAKRVVRIDVEINAPPESGLLLVGTIIESKVLLFGPSQIIREYGVIKTEPVSLAGQKVSFVDTLSLIPPFEHTWIEPKLIPVKFLLEPEKEKRFQGIPIVLEGGRNRDIYLTNRYLRSLHLAGPSFIIDTLKITDIKVILDLATLTEGEYRLKPSFKLPSQVRVKEYRPEVIQVLIRK